MLLFRSSRVLVISIIIIIIINISVVVSQPCNYVHNLFIKYRYIYFNTHVKIINGCINPDTFGGEDIIQHISIVCSESSILDRVGPNFISNITLLESFSIEKCHQFDTIDPGAFTSLPKLKYVTITGTSLNEIKRGVFSELPHLRGLVLRNNKISNVEDNAFSNLLHLIDFDLRNNACTDIRRAWFGNTRSIARFYMDHNFLREIPPGMFAGWSNLGSVFLNYNEISVVHARAFEDIPTVVRNMEFHHNRLTELSIKSFSHYITIDFLRISANLLNYLPEDFLKKTNIYYLYIHGNPFTCPCLDRIYSLMNQKNGIRVDYPGYISDYTDCLSETVPVCVVSSSSSSSCSDVVDSNATKTYLTYVQQIRWNPDDPDYEEKCAMTDALDML